MDSASADAYTGSEFVLSFSKRGDDNSRWDRYAGRDGFAIGIPVNVYLPVLGVEPETTERSSYFEEVPLRWTSMSYRPREQEAEALRALYSAHEEPTPNPHPDRDVELSGWFWDQATSTYVGAVASMKNRGFQSERRCATSWPAPATPLPFSTERPRLTAS